MGIRIAYYCTTGTIGIRCHVSANGSVVPPMVLRYWHDLRVGKGTNQHGNGFALGTFIAVVRLRSTSTYSHPTFGFATARPPLNAECCVGPAPCAFGNASSSLRCAHWSAASVLAIVYRPCSLPIRHVCAGPTQDTRNRTPNRSTTPFSNLPTLPFLPDSGSVVPTSGHVLGLWINPWLFSGFLSH